MARIYGLNRQQAVDFLQAELGQKEGTTSFYWESEETEELLEMMVDALARLVESNNTKLTEDIKANVLRDARVPPRY